MELRFLYIIKKIIYVMCIITLFVLIKHFMYLRRPTINGISRKETFNNKYILLWTDSRHIPFIYMKDGNSAFLSRKCAYTNCIVTDNKNFFDDIRMFDVIAFHAPDIVFKKGSLAFPMSRLYSQKYVFASIESSYNYPICSPRYDNYFNWTWTYKLDSEVRWGYFLIRNSTGTIVGPSKDMKWLSWNDMDDVDSNTKEILKNKKKAVAWFVSNCVTKSMREIYVVGLKNYLIKRYNLQVDIFGNCGFLKCPREKENDCNKMIETDYYFYLSFENAVSEDYITEKVLIPLKNNAVPIVYGGADYSRFLPPTSYLDARDLGVSLLGDTINHLIMNPELYAGYFKWKNHYSYHKMSESPETDEYCQMCALINDEKKLTQQSMYKDLRNWWDSTTAFC